MKEKESLFNIAEVSVMTGMSIKSLETWYRFKKECPDNEYAKMLPEIIHTSNHRQRCWTLEGVQALREFKAKIPRGRKGVMADVTQKYLRKRKLSIDK